MAKIIGIDLGTSNSAAAVMQGNRPVIIPSAEGVSLGGKAFPSYVAFTKDGQRLTGEAARRQAVTNIEGTAYAFKRKMGTDYKYNLRGKEYRPQELSAFLLQRIKQDAEAFMGDKVVEKAKIELSTTLTTEINQPFITADASGPKHLTMTLTRSKLEEVIRPVIDRCRAPMEQALSDGKFTKDDIKRVILVGGPTRMPIIQKFVEDYVGKKVEGGVDPMECVAMGAAIQAGVLSGEVKDILLLDVTPLTLGIETLGHVMTKLIDRNTTIPTRKSQIFSTAADTQTTVEIHVLQGERAMSYDNVTLGRFNLVGIPPAPRGIPQIEVTFDIDANGILHVTAKDLGTGKEQKLSITARSGLSKDEVDRIIKDAEKFAEEDKKRKEKVELQNQADTLIYSTCLLYTSPSPRD